MYYLNTFIIYSFLGYILEITFMFLADFKINSGVMYGPFTPIYGIGVVLIILIYKLINKTKLKKIIKMFFLFLFVAFTLSIIEALGGYLIEFLLGKSLWDYTNMSFNIGKYTSIEMALTWGVTSIILIYLIIPKIDKIIKKIPRGITYIVTLYIIIDLILVICNN